MVITMYDELLKHYTDRSNPMAVYSGNCTNTGGGLLIFDIQHIGMDSFIIWSYADEKKKHKSMLYWNNKDEHYFKVNGRRIKTNELLRV